MAIYNTYFSVLGLQDSLGVLPNLGVLPGLGRLDDLGEYAFSPASLFLNGEQGVWYDPSDLTPEKVSWRRNLLTYSQDFENAAWTKSNASILSNLALYSQDFDNAAWTKSDTTITANSTTAPDGTTTADSLFEAATTTSHTIFQSFNHPASVNTTSQIRVKPNGRTRVSFYAGGGADLFGAVFDLVGSGSVVNDLTSSAGTVTSRSISALTDGWYLLTIVGVRGANASSTIVLAMHQGTSTTSAAPSYTGDVTKGVFLWGAQFLPGSTAQTYTRSLATAAPIQFADPLGGTLADKLVENTANAQHSLFVNTTVTAGLTYTLSFYAKAGERSNISLYPQTGTAASANFNLSAGTSANGTITTNLISHSITAAGDGWYRCAITFLTTGTTATSVLYLRTGSGTPSAEGYVGDGVSGAFVYGAQLEQASTASAYQRITDFSSDFLAAFPTHALYQESSGVTPVTALGQSVGLVLDKRLGGVAAGTTAYTNSGNNTNGWTYAGGAGGGISVDYGQLLLTCANTISSLSDRVAYVGFPSTAGVTYRVQVTFAKGPGSGTAVVSAVPSGPDSAADSTLPRAISTTSAPTTTVLYVLATGSTSYFRMLVAAPSANSQMTASNISITSVPGNHAIQATSAARPTLQARSNLFTYSEQFDNAVWTKSSATISANTTVAPDGTTTADTLTASAGTGLLPRFTDVSTVTVNGSVYSASVFARAGTYSFVQIYLNNQGSEWANYTLTGNGTATANGSCTATISNVGSGWYRLTMTYTAGGTDRRPFFMLAASATATRAEAWNPVGTETAVFWGAQFELGTPTTYQRVTTATDYADVGLPRNLTFDGVDDSLATAGNVDFATWTVGTRRNLLTVPTMFDDATWNKTRSSITPNAIVAPDGTLTGDKLVEDTTAANSHFTNQIITLTANTTYTLSVYAKAGERNFIALQTGNVGNWSAQVVSYFNLTTGVVTASTGPAGTMVDAGNGWWRCSITGTFGASTTIGALNILLATTTSDAFAYNGNGTSGAYIWGAQIETGSTATAFQDVGTDKVTLFSGVTKLSDAALGMMTELTTGGVAGSFYVLAPNGAASPAYQWRSSGTILVNVDSPATYAAPITNVLTGIGNISGDVATIRLNGTQAATSSADQGTGNYASALLYIGRRGGTTLPFNGRLFQLVIRGAATDSVTVGNAERWVGQLTGVAL